MERRNFHRRSQQEGKSFDGYLVSLRELAKTCSFCSDECTQKKIRDQVIEGLLDGDTVESLLREKNLTLKSTISKCRAHEAAKRQRAEITGATASVSTPNVQTLRKQTPPPSWKQTPHHSLSRICQGCGSSPHPGGRQQSPATNRKCNFCKKVGHIAKVCRAKKGVLRPLALQVDPLDETIESFPEVNTSSVHGVSFEPAPTIMVSLTSLNGAATVEVLPDSGADVCVAGVSLLSQLHDTTDNLLPF